MQAGIYDDSVLLESESFSRKGGWKVDQQFIHSMGSSYLLAHGLGGPLVMNTTGQMGVAVGYAAALCSVYNTSPRGIYQNHIDELRSLIGYEIYE